MYVFVCLRVYVFVCLCVYVFVYVCSCVFMCLCDPGRGEPRPGRRPLLRPEQLRSGHARNVRWHVRLAATGLLPGARALARDEEPEQQLGLQAGARPQLPVQEVRQPAAGHGGAECPGGHDLPRRLVQLVVAGAHRLLEEFLDVAASEARPLSARPTLGGSGMWCFRMWGFNLLVLNPLSVSALGVKSPHLQCLRVDQLSCSNPTSANTTSLNSRNINNTDIQCICTLIVTINHTVRITIIAI